MADYDRKDYFYKQAKSQGYRSRAAFKLKELQKKYSIIKPGFKVVDLGAWPGGWMQVSAEIIGLKGKIVGIDLVEIDDFGNDNVKVVVGDVRDEHSLNQAREFIGGEGSCFDVLISDMSPKLSGIKEADRAGSVACAELALWAATQLLKKGGNIVMKVFQCNESQEFIRELRKSFTKIARVELDSTRKTSNEFYVVGFGFK